MGSAVRRRVAVAIVIARILSLVDLPICTVEIGFLNVRLTQSTFAITPYEIAC